ncbi:hypothetical protein F4778DRAFT_180142 [Xylariomycetidae sp. FL2044]|nr:hypothetical protein F4778DRAFT_180142 [Xylariomycetidae sp. FL2044]
MSGKREFPHGETADVYNEKAWWYNLNIAREREDVKSTQDYTARQDHLKSRLMELYEKKSHMQNELAACHAAIEYQEQERERLANDFDRNRARLEAQRHQEDEQQEAWFKRNREGKAASSATAVPAVRDTVNGRLAHRVLPPPVPSNRGWTSINGASRQHPNAQGDDGPPPDPGNLLSSIYHNPVDEGEMSKGRSMPVRDVVNALQPGTATNGYDMDVDMTGANGFQPGHARMLKPKQRRSLPSIPSIIGSPSSRPSNIDMLVEGKAKASSGRKSLPSARGSLTPATTPPTEPNEDLEITREKLVMKDDGKVVTEPPMYAGIPLERIDQNHPYWDREAEWQPIEDIIQPILDSWKEKLENLRRDPNAPRHTVFLANRQVNRGLQIFEFLNSEDGFHPYQFVGKDLINKFYSRYINYDTMFRLANVTKELKKFDLDVTPLEWLRQRMYEIASNAGDKFNMSKIVHDLYHDAKLKYLREKHGFGNIGRPSGYKLGERDPTKTGKSKARKENDSASGTTRRKYRRSIGQVDPDDTPDMDDLQHRQQLQEGGQGEYLEPVTPRLQKRPRLDADAKPTKEEEPEEDLDVEGWTSTDSFSAGRIMHLDWRIYQIKTRTLTTSTEVTQYWTWKPEKNLFEHQVLRDVHPKVTWGFYQKPINFDLTLNEVKELQYSSDGPRIRAIVADENRGDVLASFKRERTRKRFLGFARKKGIKLVKRTSAELEDIWNSMVSETMPDGGDEED